MAVTEPPAPPPPPSPAVTVEEWAKRKGHVAFLPDGKPDPRHPDYWKFLAAQAAAGWGEGRELTEADYDAAVADVEKVEIR